MSPPETIIDLHQRSTSYFPRFVSSDLAVSSDCSRQKTLASPVSCSGIGVHSGKSVEMTICPAPAGTGIVFVRSDISDSSKAEIPALLGNVSRVTLATTISNSHGYSVSTIEHVLCALSGMQIDNAIIKVNGEEVPIMDGSIYPFVRMIEEAGIDELPSIRHFIRINRDVRVDQDDSYCMFIPDNETVFEGEIDFDNPIIARQSYSIKMDEMTFIDDEKGHNISDARTFCTADLIEPARAAGFGLGASMDNTVIVDGDKVLNKDGLRSDDEFIRHKLLDAIGDMYLLGLPIIGRYRGYKSGHALHNKLMNALFADSDAFDIISFASDDKVVLAAG